MLSWHQHLVRQSDGLVPWRADEENLSNSPTPKLQDNGKPEQSLETRQTEPDANANSKSKECASRPDEAPFPQTLFHSMKTALLFIFAAFATPAEAQLNLTPNVSERQQEGMTFVGLRFSDGGHKVTYEQPRGWTYSSESKQKIVFYPPNTSQTQAKIQAGFPVHPAEFDEEGVKTLKALFLALLPKESEEREIVAEQKNRVLINGRDTYEITAAFVNYGQRCRMSVLFANLEHEQVRFEVRAVADKFEQTHRAFIESLFGMQWLP